MNLHIDGNERGSVFINLSLDKLNWYVYIKISRYDTVALVTGEIDAIISDGGILARIK